MSDLLNDNTENAQAIPFRFTRLYVSLLLILSVLLTAGQVVTQWRLSAVQAELLFIRYTSFQRHQSQQIVKQALQIADANERDRFQRNLAELRRVFFAFERGHLQSRNGIVPDLNITLTNSDTVQQLYRAVQPEFRAFQRGVRQLLTLRSAADVQTPQTQASLNLLLANESPFLRKIDGIVQLYNTQLRTRLHQLQTIELYLYGITILILLTIGLLIIRPAMARLRQTIAQLIEAESRTKAANHQLRAANQSLQETRQQLFEATRQQYKREIDEQRMRTSYLITGQEEERKRLSRELHDGLGQMLTAIKLQLEGLEGLMKRQGKVQASGDMAAATVSYDRNMANLKQLVMQTIQEVRAISNDLMPTVLSDFGVLPALKMLAESNRRSGVDVTFETSCVRHMEGSLRLNKDVEIMLYRVTQEAISNALRHGKPQHIEVELIERDDYIHLIVTDDGRGFVSRNGHDTLPKRRSGRETPSQGLHNIRERAELLKGKLNIQSTPGKGTRLRVSIPYQMQFAPYDTN